ncbi:MAG TPA: addiction module protein [Gemmataceae bacterium]|nr:addiction module protein [Gemmataceae bacterium]
MSAFDDCLSRALVLPPGERAALAQQLIRSLDAEEPGFDWEEVWAAEIQRRSDEIHSGKAVTVDAYEALERIRQSLAGGQAP